MLVGNLTHTCMIDVHVYTSPTDTEFRCLPSHTGLNNLKLMAVDADNHDIFRWDDADKKIYAINIFTNNVETLVSGTGEISGKTTNK